MKVDLLPSNITVCTVPEEALDPEIGVAIEPIASQLVD